jgi:hypothetical protein
MPVPPHDPNAETALIASCLLRPTRLQTALEQVTDADFYNPANGTLWAALTAMWTAGNEITPITYAAALPGHGVRNPPEVIMALLETGEHAAAQSYARIVAQHAQRRRLLHIAAELAEAAYNATDDPTELAIAARQQLAGFDAASNVTDTDLATFDDFIARNTAQPQPWAIPGLLRQGWRAIIVAGEGVGKSLLARQIAISAAEGIHPFTHTPIPPIVTLFVDLENPHEVVAHQAELVIHAAKNTITNYQGTGAWIWHRPAGINLRQPVDRATLETVIAKVKPQLVCIGPIYKTYRVARGENDEQAAMEVLALFDDLRTRHRFAILLEQHAPKPQGGQRELLPYGSQRWLAWPEFGFKLVRDPHDRNLITLDRFRGDRIPANWPEQLVRGHHTGWPWHGTYRKDTFTGAAA